MRYHTHILTSVTAGVAVTQFTALPGSIGLFAGIVLGSLLPDIDEPNSFIGKRTKGLSHLIHGMFGHRGFTHSILATFFIFLPYLFFPYSILLGLGMGYAFHILGDMFSKTGVPLFYPLKKRIKIPIYVTGKWSENVVFVVALLTFACLMLHVFGVTFHAA